MRSVNTEYWIGEGKNHMAQVASELAERGMDTYSGYGVGATVKISYSADEDAPNLMRQHDTHVYGGFNINLSGMECKIHAEQLALFQAMMDMEISGIYKDATLEQVVVVTTEHDHSLVCGHCIQVFNGVSDHYGWDISEIDYISAAYEGNEDRPDNFHSSNWSFEEFKLSELLGATYVSNKD